MANILFSFILYADMKFPDIMKSVFTGHTNCKNSKICPGKAEVFRGRPGFSGLKGCVKANKPCKDLNLLRNISVTGNRTTAFLIY